MPLEIWKGLSERSVDEAITVSVRSAKQSGDALDGKPSAPTTFTFQIAPASAEGSVVYWTTSNGTTLKGFSIGQETAQVVLTPSQGNGACIGCHVSTPDGLFVAMSSSPNTNAGDPSAITFRSLDGQASEPDYLTPQAKELLARRPAHMATFSPAHWAPGDRLLVNMLAVGGAMEIVWTNLEATSTVEGQGWGFVARTGDPNMAGAPAFSRDGTRLVYQSAPEVHSGINVPGASDLAIVPFNQGQGGVSQTLTGADTIDFSEFYPTWSPDDAFIAFTRCPVNELSTNNPRSELFIVPGAGGAAVRLKANDPAACTGQSSPGVMNSWPKWAPTVKEVGGRKYYWLTFSSTRNGNPLPQLYVAPVVVGPNGVETYPALHLWNQPANEANHTPAWDVFQLSLN
jgi:hypothetical protein